MKPRDESKIRPVCVVEPCCRGYSVSTRRTSEGALNNRAIMSGYSPLDEGI